jgi:chemotaxis protein CheD
MKTIVGVSDLRVSGNSDETIITYALGSCLGIAVYDRKNRIGGLLHVMLPLSKADKEKASRKPEMYVDTGVTKLLKLCYEMGAEKDQMVISVAGGASMKQTDREDYFKIGKRNFTILRKLLWKNGFMIDKKDVGGNISRTMTLRIVDGLVTVNKKPIGSAAPLEKEFNGRDGVTQIGWQKPKPG